MNLKKKGKEILGSGGKKGNDSNPKNKKMTPQEKDVYEQQSKSSGETKTKQFPPCGEFWEDCLTNGGRTLCEGVGDNGARCNMKRADHPRKPAQLQQASSSLGGDIATILKVVVEEIQSVKMGQQLLQLSIPKQYDQPITPSSNCKTDQFHTSIFNDILQVCRFGVGNLFPRSRDASAETLPAYDPNGNPELEFQKKVIPSWSWNGNEETDSYEPLAKFLNKNNIHVVDVSSGAGLPFGNLFDVKLFSLKKNLNLRSNQLPATERAICRYNLRGRTDFIRLKNPQLGISRFNIQYYIEIKPGNIGEVELREAFFQLLGGNAGNTDRSPPVFITNLTSHHYILFITLYQGADEYAFRLNIFKFNKFHQALKFLEDTTPSAHCCTRDFLRSPTPTDSPPNVSDDEDELENSKIEIEVVDEFADLALESDKMKIPNENI